MKRATLGLMVVALSCSPRSQAERDTTDLLSPDGRARARLVRIDVGTPVTQVFISMDRGQCGAGFRHQLRLHWSLRPRAESSIIRFSAATR